MEEVSGGIVTVLHQSGDDGGGDELVKSDEVFEDAEDLDLGEGAPIVLTGNMGLLCSFSQAKVDLVRVADWRMTARWLKYACQALV